MRVGEAYTKVLADADKLKGVNKLELPDQTIYTAEVNGYELTYISELLALRTETKNPPYAVINMGRGQVFIVHDGELFIELIKHGSPCVLKFKN